MPSKPTPNEKRRAMQYRESAPPDATDLEANVRWLRDREQIKNLYRRYAFGVDSIDFDLVRSVFHPECVVVGTLEEGSLDDYLEGIEAGLHQWDATMHFMGNQYIEVDGDRGRVETWVVGYHMEAQDSPLEHLVLGLRYQDAVVRVGDDWKIIRRETAKQWHTGPFPRPTLGPPSYPRPARPAPA
ncbi:MAG: nuclear transport factor 2 family protein [Deltaproteobacteria bacterium]|nr:nuclear transport factor 2 family protein [Deltaproteobacteria bacterium]MBW2361208.1 nuclear transport factor 2 family protein [Deltaproteobacteria bacterium]